MFNHIFKLMWNKKWKHFAFFIEIVIILFVLTMTILYSLGQIKNYSIPLGYDIQNRYEIFSDFRPIQDSSLMVDIKERILRDVSNIEGIESASWTGSPYPFSGNQWGTGDNQYGFYIHSLFCETNETIEKTLNLNIIKGRGFTKDDYQDKNVPIIMNEKFYNLIVQGEGHEMIDSIYSTYRDYKIVGVMDHFKQNNEFDEEKNYFFILDNKTAIDDRRSMLENLMIHTSPDINPNFQNKIDKIYRQHANSSDLYIMNLDKTRIRKSVDSWINLIVLGIISFFLLTNISFGLIGILSYGISKRKSEIGLRKAMGATTSNIITQFIGEIMLVAGIALLLGLIIIFQLPYLIEFEYPKSDLYYAALLSTLFIILLLLLSGIFPSLRGAKIEPGMALHEE